MKSKKLVKSVLNSHNKVNVPMEGLNVVYKGHKIEDVATLVGSIFGKKGQAIGKVIDKATSRLTLIIEDKKRESKK